MRRQARPHARVAVADGLPIGPARAWMVQLRLWNSPVCSVHRPRKAASESRSLVDADERVRSAKGAPNDRVHRSRMDYEPTGGLLSQALRSM
jgi:hypothetical protein